MNRLLGEFQQFWRENSESWEGRFEYVEAAPHLMLMAYLQRVVNGGGRVAREYALGMGRMDLMIHFERDRYPVEIKVRRESGNPEALGLRQLGAYLDACGAREGWLVIFDRRPDIPWDQRIGWKTVAQDGRTLHIVGC
jgi:RecB family endonuclease NucS